MSWRFEEVSGPHGFTEGPVWDGSGIIFTDMPNDRILRYNRDTGETTIYRNNVRAANGLKFGPEGCLYGCEMNGRRLVRYEEDGTESVVASRYNGVRLNGPNDLCFDTAGRVWFSDSYYQPPWVTSSERCLDHESVYRCDPSDGPTMLERMTFDTTRPNGILLSPDKKWLYVAQSDYRDQADRELRAYPVGDDGSLGKHRVIHDFYPSRAVDGMCLDSNGNIIACTGWERDGPGPMIHIFTPDGDVQERHSFPAGPPTNCCFGGADLQTLYITEKDGGLYRVKTERTGLLGAP